MKNILEKPIMTLLYDGTKDNPNGEMFYAHLLMNMKRHMDPTLPAVAAVNITDHVNLYINPEKFAALTLQEQVGVLKHEAGHVIMAHFRRFDFKDPKERMNYNLATDAAINQLIPEIPPQFSSGGMPIHINHLKAQFPNILERETSEYYYNYFKEHAPKNPQQGFGDTVDDHSKWVEGSQSDEVVRNVLKDTLQKAAESTKASHGNIPDNVQYTLNKLAKSVVDWQAQLRRFIVSAIDSKKEDTRKKRHKRFGVVHPGSKVEEILHIAFITDTSGSMSDRALEQAWTEMAKIAKLEVNITAIEADCVVQNVYKFDPKKIPSFTGRGGTAYQPALDKAEELKVDAIVFLGDMDCADTPKKPRTPVLWAVVGNQEPPGGFGRKVKVGDF
jgi:predicted metal-dependent peptidase